MDDEQVERQRYANRIELDFQRLEPVCLLTAVQQQLQAGHRQCEQGEAANIKAPLLQFIVRHVEVDTDHREDAHRHIDIKHPAPGVILGEPAAQGGAQDGTQHNAHAPGTHRLGVFLRWVGIEQGGLGKWRQ